MIDIYQKKRLLDEMLERQNKDVTFEQKLLVNDLRRIVKYIEKSIFNIDECCIWNGYITNKTSEIKQSYVNFFFKNKKVALHRLLYSNFIEQIHDNEYIKFTCENKDIYCCNINHMVKCKYNVQKCKIKKAKNIILTTTITFD